MREPEYSRMVREQDKLGMWQKGRQVSWIVTLLLPTVYVTWFSLWIYILSTCSAQWKKGTVKYLSFLPFPRFAFMFRGTYLYTASFQGPSCSSMSFGPLPLRFPVWFSVCPSILFLPETVSCLKSPSIWSPLRSFSAVFGWTKLEYHSLTLSEEASSASSDVLVNVYWSTLGDGGWEVLICVCQFLGCKYSPMAISSYRWFLFIEYIGPVILCKLRYAACSSDSCRYCNMIATFSTLYHIPYLSFLFHGSTFRCDWQVSILWFLLESSPGL